MKLFVKCVCPQQITTSFRSSVKKDQPVKDGRQERKWQHKHCKLKQRFKACVTGM